MLGISTLSPVSKRDVAGSVFVSAANTFERSSHTEAINAIKNLGIQTTMRFCQ